ncbi:hypothetical protein GCM10010346_30720 [Streptomyces chryseus]|uniref:Uncharacterized protein n=1 Tax=Streptomyces chryseus TaxID=68186 RepID=A0ABQ3DNX6_9ACTN|nr:hypothetical protein GCM10010346_30720 [Streptomyces chryseus]
MLQHARGVPDYEKEVEDDILQRRYFEPRDLLDIALQRKADFAPGLMSRPLSCGGSYWGHGGDIAGYETRGGATGGGRAASVADQQPGRRGSHQASGECRGHGPVPLTATASPGTVHQYRPLRQSRAPAPSVINL